MANTTHRAYTIVYSDSPHPDGHLGFFLPFISVSMSLSNCELSYFTPTVMSIHSRFLGWDWMHPRVHVHNLILCAMVGWFCHPSCSYKNSLSLPASQGGSVVQILILPSCLKHGASVSSPGILLYIRAKACVRRLEDNFQESFLSFHVFFLRSCGLDTCVCFLSAGIKCLHYHALPKAQFKVIMNFENGCTFLQMLLQNTLPLIYFQIFSVNSVSISLN